MNPGAFGSLPASACSLGVEGSFGPDRITKTSYNEAGEVTQARSAVGTALETIEVSTTYTKNGQTQTVTDAENNLTTYEYDGHDRLLRTRFPVPTKGALASSSTDYEELGYDAGSNIVSRRVRDGQVIGYGYDNLSRMVSKNVPNAVYFENDVTYGHDLLGRITAVHDSAGHQQSFSYDALGRKLSEGSNWYGAVSSVYDIAGRRTRLTWRDGFYVTYEHLVTGEMSAIRENGSFVLASFGYDDRGRRSSLSRGNGTGVNYGYDGSSRLSQLVENIGGTGHDQTLGFSYNPASQITSNTRSNDVFAWTGHYNVNRGYSANGLNQYTATGSITPTYDGRGNLTSAGSGSYTYTVENRIATGGGSNFAHDATGRLIHISSSATDLLYDGTDHIQEVGANGGPTRRRYVHGPGTDEPLVWYEGSGTGDRRWLHADERGSIVAITDAAGNAIAINRYDEYGIPQSTNIGRFQYTGQTWIPELGMYYYKARVYSPTLGRFLQTDPIGYDDGMNMYNYVGGDPVNFIDPSGLKTEENSDGNGDQKPDPDVVVLVRRAPAGGASAWGRGSGKVGGGSGGSGRGRPAPPQPQSGEDPCNARLPDGSTINRNVDAVRRQLLNAKRNGGVGAIIARWKRKVSDGGAWDYKVQGGGSDTQGNMNYGATGALLLPESVLLRAAGFVQKPNPENRGNWWDLGSSSYGDQPRDQAAIRTGVAQCRGNGK